MSGITCLACGWVSYAISRGEADWQIAASRRRYRSLTPEQQERDYPRGPLTIKDFGCINCGGMSFRRSKPGDSPPGVTINPAVCDEFVTGYDGPLSVEEKAGMVVNMDDLADDFRITRNDLDSSPAAESALFAIAAGVEPSAITLGGAPVLENWKQTTNVYRQAVLAGSVIGHPHVIDGPIHTSAILAMALDLSWARTSSRWYRLGAPSLAETPTEEYADGDDGKRLGWHSHDYQMRRVAAVQAVLDEIAAGRHPTTQDLASAPILHGWSWAPHPIQPETDVIWAFGTQHPVVGNSHLYTGRVWSMAVDKSWARTTERFYRLGQPAGRRKIEGADRKNLVPGDALR